MKSRQAIALLFIFLAAMLIVGADDGSEDLETNHGTAKGAGNVRGVAGDADSVLVVNEWEPVPLRSENQKTAGFAGGEGMQMIWGLSYAPSNPDILYLVSDTSQVWKSEDGGHSWKMKHEGFLANGGLSLVIDPNNENVVFVAGSQHASGSDELADGIYRTKDGGESWELVRQTPFCRLEPEKGGVNFAFAGSNTIYAATQTEGVLKSIDGGDTWFSLDVLSNTKLLDIKVNPQDPSILFLASEDGLFRFTDLPPGTLEEIRSNLTDFPRAVVVHPSIIYVSAGEAGVLKSTDGGNTFLACNNGLYPIDDGFGTTYLTMSPANPDYLYVSFYMLGGNHPYYTHDGCSSWHPPSAMDVGLLMREINNDEGGEFWSTPIAASPIDENTAITSGAGNHIEKTTDGGNTFRFSGDGYCGGRAGTGSTSFGWDPHNPDRFAIFLIDFGVVLTKDGGSTFKNLRIRRYKGEATTPVGALDPTQQSEVIVTAVGTWDDQIIAITQDEGETWEFIEGTEDKYTFIAFHPQNSNIIYAGKHKSIDKGISWNELSKRVIAVFPNDGDVVYAIDKDEEHYQATVLKSTDGGTTWTRPYGIVNTSDIEEIAIAPDSQDRIYLATLWNGITMWNGTAWVQRNDGLDEDCFESLSTRNIAIDPNYPNVMYAGKWISFRGHANGVFRSVDHGQTWENITKNLGPEFTPWAISVNPHNGYVYIGSSHGTWKLPPPGDTQADLIIAKTDDPDPVAPGGILTYTLSVTNTGPSDATGVIITDTLPVKATLVAATPSQGAPCGETSGIITCDLGSLAIGNTAIVTIVVTVDPSTRGTMSNLAGVTAATTDPDTDNNTVTEDTMVEACYDLDGNGQVDVNDIMLVASHWQTAVGDPDYVTAYDPDGNGVIDIVDVMLVATQWGKRC